DPHPRQRAGTVCPVLYRPPRPAYDARPIPTRAGVDDAHAVDPPLARRADADAGRRTGPPAGAADGRRTGGLRAIHVARRTAAVPVRRAGPLGSHADPRADADGRRP